MSNKTHFIRKSLFYYFVRFILISLILSMTFVLLISTSVHAQVNPYEIIELSLNKKFVQEHERIEVSGSVNNFNPDFKHIIRILETKEGHRIDYDTTVVDKDDGSFEFYWQVGAIYDSTWVSNSEYVIKMNYAGIDNWKELEFVYCDKRQQESQAYLKFCQEAYGFVKSPNDSPVVQSIESLDSKIESEPRTKFENGMEFVQKCSLKDLAEGKSGTQCDWVESDRNYFNRIMIPLIFNIIVIGVILGIIILVIYKVITRSKSTQAKAKSLSKGQLSYLENTPAEETIKFFIQNEYGDKKRLNDILKSINANGIINDSDKKYMLSLLEKTRGWDER
jgi:hypothetical protein